MTIDEKLKEWYGIHQNANMYYVSSKHFISDMKEIMHDDVNRYKLEFAVEHIIGQDELDKLHKSDYMYDLDMIEPNFIGTANEDKHIIFFKRCENGMYRIIALRESDGSHSEDCVSTSKTVASYFEPIATYKPKLEAGQRWRELRTNSMMKILYVGKEVLLGQIIGGCEASWTISYFVEDYERLD